MIEEINIDILRSFLVRYKYRTRNGEDVYVMYMSRMFTEWGSDKVKIGTTNLSLFLHICI